MAHVYGLGDCDEVFGDVDAGQVVNPDRPCTKCGEPIGPRRKRWCSKACGEWFMENHIFSWARVAVMKAAREGYGYRCAFCSSLSGSVEVDHIEAANGSHSQRSCLHHQSNLRVLCRECHRERTRLQRAARKAVSAVEGD